MAFVGSFAGFEPQAGLTTYAATKGFVGRLAESLAYELQGSNLDISCYSPMGITTNMTSQFTKPGLFSEENFNISHSTAVRSHL